MENKIHKSNYNETTKTNHNKRVIRKSLNEKSHTHDNNHHSNVYSARRLE